MESIIYAELINYGDLTEETKNKILNLYSDRAISNLDSIFSNSQFIVEEKNMNKFEKLLCSHIINECINNSLCTSVFSEDEDIVSLALKLSLLRNDSIVIICVVLKKTSLRRLSFG